MQDRFKFRVWKKYNCPSYQGHKPEMFYNAEKTYDLTTNQIPENCFNDILENEKEYIVMQCTGLKDKNGKLIYEGDIVTYDCTDLFPHTTIKTGKITWCKSSWVIGYFDKNIVYMGTNEPTLQRIWLGNDDFIGSRIEVIGNIYANPELLESEPTNE